MHAKLLLFVILGAFIAGSVGFQFYQIYTFMNAGSRFTAQDGQSLCRRVQELERRSYGFRDAGKVLGRCDYGESK